MEPAGLVEATERLYRSLFTVAVVLALSTALWGMVIAPFNGFNDHVALSLLLGVVLVSVSLGLFACRRRLFVFLRQQPGWLLVLVALSVAVLWADGGWRSSYYLASYAAIGLTAVAAGLRWSLLCATALALGYVAGLGVNGYSWAELEVLNDADSVVANTGGYFIAACFLAIPVGWLGGYVARIHQIAESATSDEQYPSLSSEARRLTDKLTVREVEVAQLVAGGASNEEIAETLTISARTVHSHVENAMRKTAARNRTALAVIAVRAGLVPDRTAIPPDESARKAEIRISTD